MPATPKRTGYRFLGWNTKPDGEGDFVRLNTILNESQTLYGIWGRASSSDDDDDDKPTTPAPEPQPETHDAYLFGYEDSTLRPQGNITRGETAAIFARLMGIQNNNTYPSSFTDVRGNEWHANPIGYLAEKNIIAGYPDGTFRADTAITRAEFAAIAAKFTQAYSTPVFSDLVTNHWAYDAIGRNLGANFIGGYPDGTFRPQQPITRAEAVKITNRIFERYPDHAFIDDSQGIIKAFPDLIRSHWAYYELVEAFDGHAFIRLADHREDWQYLLDHQLMPTPA